MSCHICGAEAIERCYTCGGLFCAEHGHQDCVRCQTGVMEGDPRPDRISAEPFSRTSRPGWWRTQQAEEYDPPACYVCKGLTRSKCRNCDVLYCREHGTPAGLCANCDRSSRIGAYVFVGAIAAVLLVVLIGQIIW